MPLQATAHFSSHSESSMLMSSTSFIFSICPISRPKKIQRSNMSFLSFSSSITIFIISICHCYCDLLFKTNRVSSNVEFVWTIKQSVIIVSIITFRRLGIILSVFLGKFLKFAFILTLFLYIQLYNNNCYLFLYHEIAFLL